MTTPELERINGYVLDLVQAMLGAISPNFRAVWLDVADEVEIWFLLDEESGDDRMEIEDVEAEFYALQDHLLNARVHVLVDRRPFHEIGWAGRLVYKRREAAPAEE